jgi:hypothetical protein
LQGRGLLMLLAGTLALGGCRGYRNSWEDVREESDRRNNVAKTYLAEGRYTDAKLKFEEVLKEVDGSNAEARFGAVLSELLQFASIIRVVSQLTGEAADENDFLHALIDDLLTDLRLRFERLSFELTRLKSDPQFTFVLKQPTPVYLTSTETPDVDLQGEWDRGEVFLVDAGVQLILGVLNLAQAIDLEADYLGIYNEFTESDIELDLGDGVEGAVSGIERQMPKIQELLTYVLNRNPNFLGLDTDTGEEQMHQAGLRLGNAIDSLRKGLYFASRDILHDENQGDDVIGFDGRSSGSKEPIDPDADLCDIRDNGTDADLRASTFEFQIRLFTKQVGDGWEKDPSVLESVPGTGCVVGKLMDSLLPPGDVRIEDPNARINLAEDVVPLLIDVLRDVTGLGNIINEDLIIGFIGNSIELDAGEFFYSGLGPRDLLPAWDTPSMVAADEPQLLWWENECSFDPLLDAVTAERTTEYPEFATKATAQPYRVIDRFYCRESVDDDTVLQPCSAGADPLFCDLLHFPAENTNPAAPGLAGGSGPSLGAFGVSQIERDGLSSVLPAFAFRDPTFGGILYLDVYAFADQEDVVTDHMLAIDASVGFSPADQASLNAYLALLGSQVKEILDLF